MKRAIVLALYIGACAHKQVPAQTETETVGTLSQSYRSIAVAPVKTTDEQATDQFVTRDKEKQSKDLHEEITPDVATKHDCEFSVDGCGH